MALTEADKKRIQEEEAYRAQVGRESAQKAVNRSPVLLGVRVVLVVLIAAIVVVGVPMMLMRGETLGAAAIKAFIPVLALGAILGFTYVSRAA